MKKLLAVVLFGILTSGCAIGNKHNYDTGGAKVSVLTENTVAVGAVDLRPYILNNDKSPNFVGLRRGGFGNPFNVSTASGKPMAFDMSSSITKSLSAADIKAFQVDLSDQTSLDGARNALLAADAARYMLLLIYEWKADTFSQTSVAHNISLQVYGDDGTRLAEASEQGKDAHPPAVLEDEISALVVSTFNAKVSSMVNNENIRNALK